MNEQLLVDTLSASCGDRLPSRADVLSVKQLSLDELQGRALRFLSVLEPADACRSDRPNWDLRGDRTLARLPDGARASVYHASGALRYVSGMGPMEALFPRMEEPASLVRAITAVAGALKLGEWSAERGELAFERLWRTKAQGSDRDNKMSAPVLCRATGAFRQSIGGIPVLGAASVAITLAGDGRIDALSVQMRPVAEALDTVQVMAPEQAARQVAQRLAALLGKSRERLPSDVIEAQSMQFGYLDLGKRKRQRVLAPAFVAQIALRHRLETQAYLIAVPATETPWLELPLFGMEAAPMRARAACPNMPAHLEASSHSRAGGNPY